MSLRITSLYPEYQNVVTDCGFYLNGDNKSGDKTAKKPSFARTATCAVNPALLGAQSDIVQINQDYTNYVNEINRLNSKADDKQKFKHKFGVLTNKEGNADYLKTGVYGLSFFVPSARRMQSSFDAADDGNYFRVGGMAAVAAANLPSDWREMTLAFNDIKKANFKGQEFQHRGSFFKGTILEPLTDKYKWLGEMDKTFAETKFGENMLKLLGVKVKETKEVEQAGKIMKISSYEGGLWKQVIGKAFLRTSVIGVGLSSLFEVPAIFSAAKKGSTFSEKTKSVFKQTLKSAGNILFITGAMAVAGGLSVTGAGFAASLPAMALGSAIGILASKGFNKVVDKVIP